MNKNGARPMGLGLAMGGKERERVEECFGRRTNLLGVEDKWGKGGGGGGAMWHVMMMIIGFMT